MTAPKLEPYQSMARLGCRLDANSGSSLLAGLINLRNPGSHAGIWERGLAVHESRRILWTVLFRVVLQEHPICPPPLKPRHKHLRPAIVADAPEIAVQEAE